MKRVLKPKTKTNQNSALNQARALYYDFFAGFFVFELLDSRKSLFEKQIDILTQSPIDSADLATFSALKNYIAKTDLAMIKREYSQTFDIPFGAKPEADYKGSKDLKGEKDEAVAFEKLHKTLKDLPKGQIFLYLSHYTEGCLNGASLLKVRQIVKQTRFRLNKDGFKESEEHFGFLLLFMRYLLRDSAMDLGESNADLSESSVNFGESNKDLGESGKDSSESSANPISANDFFNECLRQMASKIADLLSKRDDLPCYQKVGFLLKNFIKLEEEICDT